LGFIIVFGWLASGAAAHPVSFQGGWSFMGFNQPDMQDWQLLYTFHRRFSLGVDYFHDRMTGRDRDIGIPRLSWLVQRWNGADYQANIYVYGGVGGARVDGTNRLAAEGSLETDYETRKVYGSAKATIVGVRDSETLAVYQLRAGFAPYVGAFDDLHSWLIAQVQYYPFSRDEMWRVGPVVRLFYRNVLTEMGVSARGTWSLNFMVHW